VYHPYFTFTSGEAAPEPEENIWWDRARRRKQREVAYHNMKMRNRKPRGVKFISIFISVLCTISLFWNSYTISKEDWNDMSDETKIFLVQSLKTDLIRESPGCTGGQMLLEEKGDEYIFYYRCIENMI